MAFDRYTMLNLHALLAESLLADPNAEGRLRQIEVRIGHSVYHPLAVPQLIEECFDLLLATAAAITDPFEQAFFVMVHLPYLQPFEDVNKRVSRLRRQHPLHQGQPFAARLHSTPSGVNFYALRAVGRLRVEPRRPVEGCVPVGP